MKRYLVVFLFTTGFFTSLWSQPEKISMGQVISTTGLNLRSEPNAQSSIIATLPFGTKLKLTGLKSNSLDSVGAHRFHFDPKWQMRNILPVVGYWQQVEYKGRIGWVHGSYLLQYYNKLPTYESGVNQRHVLLKPGYDCFSNFWFNNKLNWYGIYREGRYKVVKPISLSFFIIDREVSPLVMRDPACVISAQKNRGLLFIFGTTDNMKIKRLEGRFYGFWSDKKITIRKEFQVDSIGNSEVLYLKKHGQKQLLTPVHPEYQFYFSPYNLVWEGDLDGDGKSDYIIRFGDKSRRTILFLSSEAREGEIVRPVAVYYSGYCC